jgi:thiamine biosynthesis lipoprotein
MILATCAPAPAQLSTAAAEPQLESIERRLGAMGTSLRVSVEAPDRATALAASEAAVRAIEGCEQRLSTWRDDSELAQLNRAPVGVPFELSTELTDELAGARHWWRETGGAFDPAVGALVEAWGLRNGGRTPTADELERGRVPAGFGALVLERPSLEGAALEATATRRDARLVVEEGGFGKGAGLDAAHRALRDAGAVRGVVDLGGQLIVFGDPGQEAFHFGVADPDERDRMVLQLSIDAGSIATSGNSERAIVVDGEDPTRIGHLLDPRTARPCDDFGSLTVWVRTGSARTGSARTGSARTGSARTGSARTGSVRTGTDRSGLAADCLSTGLYVMGPEKALAWAEEHDGVEVLALVRGAREEDGLVARATSGLDGRIQVLAQGVRAQAVKDDEDAVSVEYEQG